MELLDPNEIWKLKDIILSRISIIDIAREYGITLEEKDTGTFTHRSFCPFHVGKGAGGRERTPSMFFSRSSNSFCCFGCSQGGNVLDFVIYMDGTPRTIALTKLAKKAGIIDKDGKFDELLVGSSNSLEVFYDPMKTIDPYLFKIGDILREYIFRFVGTEDEEKEVKWFEKVGAKVDSFLINIGHEDWEYAKDLSEKVERAIKKRLKSKGE